MGAKKFTAPTKKHFALNTTTGMYNLVLFGEKVIGKSELNISFDVWTHYVKVPRGSVDCGKFKLSKGRAIIDGALFLDYSPAPIRKGGKK